MKSATELTIRASSTGRISEIYSRLVGESHRLGYPLLSLVRRDFKTRYAATSLGLGWAVMQPLAFMSLYILAFSVILKVRFHPGDDELTSAIYLLCGLIPYIAISESIHRAATSLKENRSLIEKVVFPEEVLPAVSVVSAAITELIGLVLLVTLNTIFKWHIQSWILLLPVIVVLQAMFTLGLAWLVSVLSVFIKDLAQMVGLLLTGWMFLTPIFYPLQMAPSRMGWLFTVNPLYHFITVYRSIVVEGGPPKVELAFLMSCSAGIFLFGLWFFRKTVQRAKDFL